MGATRTVVPSGRHGLTAVIIAENELSYPSLVVPQELFEKK